jgi:glyoxylase-like metal-dependent hydrolase (beta-lactamase superfamily II)
MTSPQILRISTQLGSNCYLIKSNPAVIIDTGHPLFAEQTLALLQREASLSSVKYIFCTHSHPDHYGATALLKEHTNAQIYQFTPAPDGKFTPAHQEELFLKIPTLKPDRIVYDNEEIILEDDIIKVLHTPGHHDDHCCFYFTKKKLLFTGDLLANDDIGGLNLNYYYKNSLEQMKISFERCAALETRGVFPGHGERFRIGPWDKCRRKLSIFEHNPELLIAHGLISPLLFHFWIREKVTSTECEEYITDHAYLLDGYVDNCTVDKIVTEFRKLLSLFLLREIVLEKNGILMLKNLDKSIKFKWLNG